MEADAGSIEPDEPIGFPEESYPEESYEVYINGGVGLGDIADCVGARGVRKRG